MSSHIEGYVEDLGEIALQRIPARQMGKSSFGPSFRYYLSRDLISALQQTEDPVKIPAKVDALLFRDGHIWDSTPGFSKAFEVAKFLEGFSNPKHERIVQFFGRFGYIGFTRDLGRRLAANYLPCKNMIDQVVEQRNRIAHGDMVATGTPADLAQMISLVKLYCREMDRVVGDWFRSQGCPLR